jgi:hypothetical protein
MTPYDAYTAGYRAALFCRGYALLPATLSEAEGAKWLDGFLRGAADRAAPKLEPIVAAAIASRKEATP